MKRATQALGILGWLVIALPVAADDASREVAEAQAIELANALPPTRFYSDPVSLTGTKPGDLLRQEGFAGYTVVEGMKAVRILYHSQDAARGDVVTSAVVLVPPGTAPQGGWPVIAWAHGTSGVAQPCAPSLMKDLYYGTPVLTAMLTGGFAVVATDYRGLGTAGPTMYGSKQAQALDVIYAMPAARAAVPELGRHWVADGHSQGGFTTWGVAELESQVKDDGYLGAISVAGAFQVDELMQTLNQGEGAFYLAYIASGIQGRFPAFRPEDLLSHGPMQLYSRVTAQGCWYYAHALYKDIPKGTTLKEGWKDNVLVKKWVKENNEGVIRISKPLLVLAGEADRTIPIEGVRRIVQRACRAGSALTFKSYPGLDHSPVMVESLPYQLEWIRERLAGTRAASTCTASTAK
jgi:pimeloyl-ACP methyl ester carboxylesterase